MSAGLNLPNCRVWRLGADVDTDVLAPGAYMKHGLDIIAVHCLESLRPSLRRKSNRATWSWLARTSALAHRASKRPLPCAIWALQR